MQMRSALRLFRRLVAVGSMGGALRWLLLTWRGRQRNVKLLIHGIPVEVRAATPDAEVALSCLSGEFDEVVRSMPQLAHQLIIDAGGYIGTAAIAFARAYPGAQIICLEPSSENFALLARNVQPYPNIRAIRKALSDEHGTLELKDRGTGQWGFTIVATPADRRAAQTIGVVECTTVQALLSQLGRSGIDIFKIDIEGGEYRLLRHNADWLAATSAICIELHDRIVPGCTEAFVAATAGRRNTKLEGEKYLSLAGLEA